MPNPTGPEGAMREHMIEELMVEFTEEKALSIEGLLRKGIDLALTDARRELAQAEQERDRWKAQSDDWQKRGWELGKQVAQAEQRVRVGLSLVDEALTGLIDVREALTHFQRIKTALTPQPAEEGYRRIAMMHWDPMSEATAEWFLRGTTHTRADVVALAQAIQKAVEAWFDTRPTEDGL